MTKANLKQWQWTWPKEKARLEIVNRGGGRHLVKITAAALAFFQFLHTDKSFSLQGPSHLLSSPFWTPPTPSALPPLCFSVLSLLARAPTDSHTFATLTPVPAVKGWKGRDMSVLLARESPLSSAVPANRSPSAICGRNGSQASQTSFAEAGSTRGAGRDTVINSLRY